jgi:hypothetical protein
MNSNDEYVNQITLKYLTTIDYQNDVHGVNNLHNNSDKINKSKHMGSKIYRQKDKKFYKKRILNIIKLLLNDYENDKNDITHFNYPFFPDIKSTFDIFVKSCIDYLKSQDKCDIIQNDYNNLNIENVLDSVENKNNNVINNNVINNNEINALMMRKILKKKNSIDSFVKRTPTKQVTTIIPQKKKINLHNPELKTKGLGGVDNVTNIQKNETHQKDKKIGENKNNNIYKENISELDTLLKNYDNQEEKTTNKKKTDKKLHKKQKRSNNSENTQTLSTSLNTNE